MGGIDSVRAGLRRALAFVAGGWVALVPGCGAQTARTSAPPEPTSATPEPAAPAPATEGADRPDLTTRTSPFEPGPIPDDVGLPIRLDQSTPRDAFDDGQWALFEAWRARTGDEAPTLGSGQWTASIDEHPQPWLPTARFFAAGGLRGAHFPLRGVQGVLYGGWPLFRYAEPERGALLYCRAELWTELEALTPPRPGDAAGADAFREGREALFARHCVDLWPELWVGLEAKASAEELEPQVLELVEFWASRDGGRAKVVRTAADMPKWAGPGGPQPIAPEPTRPTPPDGSFDLAPKVDKSDDGHLHASGVLVHFTDSIDTASRFRLDAGPERCRVERESLGHSAPRMRY